MAAPVDWLRRHYHRFRQRIQSDRALRVRLLLWLLCCLPLLIVPPVLALVALRTRRLSNVGHEGEIMWMAAAACLNLVLSVALLMRLHDVAHAVLLWFQSAYTLPFHSVEPVSTSPHLRNI